MASRRLPLILAPFVVLGLMAVALLLALDGESPTALLPGAMEAQTTAPVAAPGPASAANDEAEDTSRRRQRPGRITGDVRDLGTRDPVTGRTVTLTLAGGDIRQITTDAEGAFGFGSVPAESPHEIRVDGVEKADVVRTGLMLRAGEHVDLGTLWLADGVPVEIEVRSFDGRPLHGATVRAFALGPGAARFDTPLDPPPVALVHTGEDGVGRFDGLPPGSWTFTAERGGYARRGLVDVTVRPGVARERFQLALERGHRLSGRVVDGTGRPVSGAPVLAIRRTLASAPTTAPLGVRTVSDRDGRFTLHGLPAADMVLWSGWPRGRLAVLAAVRLPGVESLDLVLLRGGRLDGRVTREDDESPAAGATVGVSLRVLGAFQLWLETETDADGRYALDLPMPGHVSQVVAALRGHQSGSAELDDELQVLTGDRVTQDIRLSRGGVITGRVLGPDGPIAGAEVGATNRGWYMSTTSDRAGRFEIDALPRERFFVLATMHGYTMPDRPEDPDAALDDGTAPGRYVVDLAADPEPEVEIALVAGPVLRGRVETHDGAPAGGALVRTLADVATHAAADGTFELGPLEGGEHEIVAVARDGGARGTARVEIPPGAAEPQPVTIRLGPSLRVTGRLHSAHGAPLEGAYVQIVPGDGDRGHPVQEEWSWLESPRLPVHADGTFQHFVDGSIGGFVVRAGALGHRHALSGRLAVADGQPEAHVEITLEAGETFTGRVVNLDGEPVPGAYVSAVEVPPGTSPNGVDYPGAWGPPIVAVADANGVFRVNGLAAAPHAVRVWAPGHLPDARVVSVPEDSSATFEIVAALSIEGTLVYADGTPVVGARVAAMHDDGGGWGEARTDANGRFSIGGLEAGTYRLEAAPGPSGRPEMIGTTLEGVVAGSHVRITVQRGETLSGRVVSSAGDPVSGAVVRASVRDDDVARCTTDADGAFTLRGLPPGVVTLRVDSARSGTLGTPTLDARVGTEGVEIRLPEPAPLEGTLHAPDGAALVGQLLRLLPRERAAPHGVLPSQREIVTQADGRFVALVAPGETYEVTLPEHPGLRLPDGTVVRGGDTGLRLVAVEGAGISGRVLGENGEAVGGTAVYASRDGETRYTVTATDGAFALRGLRSGAAYSLWISGSEWQMPGAVEAKAGATGVRLVARALLALGGRLVSDAGQPLRHTRVQVRSGDGHVWTTSTGDDAAFLIHGAHEGTYEIWADPHGEDAWVECGTLEAGTTDAEIRCVAR